jgi:hypothetical protein
MYVCMHVCACACACACMKLLLPSSRSWPWRRNPNPAAPSQSSSPPPSPFKADRDSASPLRQIWLGSGMEPLRPAPPYAPWESDPSPRVADWSIGWFEPLSPGFCAQREPDSSFAVLVPCYDSSSLRSAAASRKPPGTLSPSQDPFFSSNPPPPWIAVLSGAIKSSESGEK